MTELLTHSGLRYPVIRRLIIAVGLGATILATVILTFALQARARLPELHAWHRVGDERDFRAGVSGAAASFAAYLALEERLFADIRRLILENPNAADRATFSRYNPKSVVSHLAFDTTYNRSYELAPAGEPRGSVLLVHGLTDSPYSVRSLAETFVARGFYVVALRLPGHGTTPAGLLNVTWEDWYGALVLAAKYTASRGGAGNPFLAGGHSAGAALVTLYSLRAIQDSSLPRPQQLYLVSTAIGISPFAATTHILSGLAFIPAFEKSWWLDVLPEYDPYKYNSFPVNAANQVYKLTQAVQNTLDQLSVKQLAAMPRVHAYHSIVDSTVKANQVVRGLLARLPVGNHELLVFDINRYEQLAAFIASGPLEDLERLRATIDLPFRITLITNHAPSTRRIAAYTRAARQREVIVKELPYEWPSGVFSVGHVSLPFPSDDPVYGLTLPSGMAIKFNLGAISAKGESGALGVELGTFSRLRSNPFFEVIRSNVLESLTPPNVAR